MLKSSFAVFLVVSSILQAQTTDTPVAPAIRFASPDGTFEVETSISPDGFANYQVFRDGEAVLAPSRLGVVFEGNDDSSAGGFMSMQVLASKNHAEEWKPVWGERSTVSNRYHEETIAFRGQQKKELLVDFRVYDTGAAFRYALLPRTFEPKPANRKEATPLRFRIARELTDFRFEADHDVWAVTSAQGKYYRRRLSELTSAVERPCVLENDDGTFVAIAEAALVDYARMRLRGTKSRRLGCELHNEKKKSPVELTSIDSKPVRTPWRVIMAADSPGELLEHNDLLLNLNQACQLRDTDWIRPGKVIREVSLSTEGGKACVDFAVKYGLQFVEYDAGWYGSERDEKSDARTVSRKGLNLQEVIDYANSKGIGIIVYVNRRHLETQLDELLPLYKKWGIAGIKYGFVQHGSQKWTRWMHDAIRKTAEHQIMVDVHDEYRMTGWQRTYPNFMTAEGIGGDETRPTHEQALTNLFTRMIASPADHTFCYYAGYVDEKSTHASQLAKSVCFFSPWQFLFWYDRPSIAQDEPELQFFKHLPTTWDESRVLSGKIGQYAAIARRKGNQWFVGCLNAVEPRTMKLWLDFLPPNQRFEATLYQDDANVKTRTKVAVEKRDVDSQSVIDLQLPNPGGMAMRLAPAK